MVMFLFLILTVPLHCFAMTQQWYAVDVDREESDKVLPYKLDYDDPNLAVNFVSFCLENTISALPCHDIFKSWFVDYSMEFNLKNTSELLHEINQFNQLLPNHGRVIRFEDIMKDKFIRTETTESLESLENEVVSKLLVLFQTRHNGSAVIVDNSRFNFVHSCSLQYQTTDILTKLLNETIASGLIHKLEFQIVLNYGLPLPMSLLQYYSSLTDSFVFVQVTTDSSWGELPTLRVMHKLNTELLSYDRMQRSQQQPPQPQQTNNHKGKSKDNDKSIQYLYLHTKGVSYIKLCSYFTKWTDLMLLHAVTRHERNYHLLASGAFDVIGIYYDSNIVTPSNHNNITSLPQAFGQLYSQRNESHILGNFWWTTGEHLTHKLLPPYSPNDNDANKYDAEQWIVGERFDIPCSVNYPPPIMEGVMNQNSGSEKKLICRRASRVYCARPIQFRPR